MTDRVTLQFIVAAKLHEVYGGHCEAAWLLAGAWLQEIDVLDTESAQRLFVRTAMFNREVGRELDRTARRLAEQAADPAPLAELARPGGPFRQ